MACPFPPALPQHTKQCWHNWGPKSHRPAGLAQLMRPRWRLPTGTPQRVFNAARAFQYESRMPQETAGSLRWPEEARGSDRTPQGGPGRAVTGDDGDNDGKASDGADDGDDSGRIWTCARGDARACRPRGIFCTGFAPWVHDRASRLHRAVT